MSYYFPRAAIELRILPEDFQLSSDPTTQAITKVIVVPRQITVNRNDYKTADTFSAEIDYSSFPFDPRTIRACGVVIYMQDMEKLYNDDGTVNEIIPGAPTSVNPDISNAVFIGWVDEDEITLDEQGRTVRFTGRDTTALLIDQKYTSQKGVVTPSPSVPAALAVPQITKRIVGPLNAGLPLDKAIKQLLLQYPATSQIQVYSSPGAVMPIISTYDPSFGQPLGGTLNTGGGKRENYWDIILDLAGRAGLVCYMGIGQNAKGDIAPTIYLVTPKNQGLDIDTSTGQQSTETIDDIKVIYGKNVKNLKLKRKIGRMKNFNIRVISRNNKSVVSANIPEEATQVWCNKYGISRVPVNIPTLKPDGSVDNSQQRVAPYIAFPISKIASKAALIQIGQTLYEQYSLQQLEGSFTTREMLGRGTTKDSSVDNRSSFTTYDMTQIKKGQTICLEINSDDLQQISRFVVPADRVQYLVAKGYDPQVADLFAKTIGKMSPRFQIKSYKMDMSHDAGWELQVEFYNLIDNTYRTLTGGITALPATGGQNSSGTA